MDDLAGRFEIDAAAKIVAAEADDRDPKTGLAEISLFHLLPRTRSVGEGGEYFVECRQLVAIDGVGDEHRGVETGLVPSSELLAHLRDRPVSRVVGDPPVGPVVLDVVPTVFGERPL